MKIVINKVKKLNIFDKKLLYKEEITKEKIFNYYLVILWENNKKSSIHVWLLELARILDIPKEELKQIFQQKFNGFWNIAIEALFFEKKKDAIKAEDWLNSLLTMRKLL